LKKGGILFYLILFSLCFFFLGYFRNFIFLNINERASLLYYKSAYPQFPSFMNMFESYNYNQLVTAKWILTFSFTLIYSLLSATALYVVFNQRQVAFITLGLYGLLFIISLIFIISGRIFLQFYVHGFSISRNITHFQQSPVITIVLLLGVYYYKNNK
jgi:hypothetical protein